MSEKLKQLQSKLEELLSSQIAGMRIELNELTLIVEPVSYLKVCAALRDHVEFKFEQLIDLCGIDYSSYKNEACEGGRFACVVHLLSIAHNTRIRLIAIAQDDEFPVIPSLVELWSAASWYEREAFDLYGIVFEGHPDLRRLLTDYGFIGHPFRKDFPLSGHVEMRYDPEQKRVVYQAVTIEPREVTPRIVREEHYGGAR